MERRCTVFGLVFLVIMTAVTELSAGTKKKNNTRLLVKEVTTAEKKGKWFDDDLHVSSQDGSATAFRRCAGEREYPNCIVFLRQSPKNDETRPVGTRLIKRGTVRFNFIPVGFWKNTLLIANPADVYIYNLNTGGLSLLVKDAWSATISPDESDLAFLSSYRTNGANLHLMNLEKGMRVQLTRFNGGVPHGLKWISGGKQILFELEEDRSHKINTWRINRDGSSLTKLADKQMDFDKF